jgi:hypothetical protein
MKQVALIPSLYAEIRSNICDLNKIFVCNYNIYMNKPQADAYLQVNVT